MSEITVRRLGLMPYKAAWDYQEQLFAGMVDTKISKGHYEGDDYLLLVEHPPVFTIGKSGRLEHLLGSESLLQEKGIELFRNNRGGDITYHGPGQLVVYPVLDLEHYFTDIRKYMRSLEEVVIRILKEYDIAGQRSEGETGVWLDVHLPQKVRKICAMGVRTSRWVTMHGLALNVNTDLSYFDWIVPCGISDKGVTSMRKETGKEIAMEDIEAAVIRHFGEVFEVAIKEDRTC